jgi:hypothetical protein
MKKKCSVPGCKQPAHHGKPLCFQHWLAIPDRFRLRMAAASGAFQGARRGASYRRALAEAVATIMAKG